MIISRPSGVRLDSGDPSSLPARTGNNSVLLALWSWGSWAKRQDRTTPPSPLTQTAHPLPSAVLLPTPPPFSPTPITPSSLSVVTGDTPSYPLSNELESTSSSSPCIPLETTAVSSNTPTPAPRPSWSDLLPSIYRTESSTVLETYSPIPTSGDFPILSLTVTPTSIELEATDDGLGSNPGLGSTVTSMDKVTPDSTVGQGNSARGSRNAMNGAIIASVSIAFLLLLGIIFFLRRCVNKKPSNLAVDTTRATSAGLSPQAVGQLGGGTIAQGQDSFLDHGSAPIRGSTPTVATAQGRCSQPGRSSQISTASSISRSIRFAAVAGSFYSSAGSYISQAAVSMIAVDGAHTPGDDVSGEPVPPWTPVSVDTSCDYSASWRGTNLSNIINAARGIKR